MKVNVVAMARVCLQQRLALSPRGDEFTQEHPCWDPRHSELCLNRVKPEETLVEARSGTDVQIVRQTWA